MLKVIVVLEVCLSLYIIVNNETVLYLNTIVLLVVLVFSGIFKYIIPAVLVESIFYTVAEHPDVSDDNVYEEFDNLPVKLLSMSSNPK